MGDVETEATSPSPPNNSSTSASLSRSSNSERIELATKNSKFKPLPERLHTIAQPSNSKFSNVNVFIDQPSSLKSSLELLSPHGKQLQHHPPKLFYLKVRFRRREILVLIDLGAAKSVVSETFLNSTCTKPYKPIPIEPARFLLTNIEGNALANLGCVPLELELAENDLLNEYFHIIPSSCIEILIGSDLIGPNCPIQIDTNALMLTHHGNKYSMIPITIDKEYHVAVTERKDLPVFKHSTVTVSILHASTDFNLPPGSPVLFTPTFPAEDIYGFSEGVYKINKNGTIELDLNYDQCSEEDFIPASVPLGIIEHPQILINATKAIPIGQMETTSPFSYTDSTKLGTEHSVTSLFEEPKSNCWKNRLSKYTAHLSTKRKKIIDDIIIDYASIFPENPDLEGPADVSSCAIDTGSATPVHITPRRRNPREEQKLYDFVQDYLRRGIIRKVSGPWSAPVVLVGKKDGSTRFCVDYRRLNTVTRKDVHPIPRIDSLLDKLSRAKYFTSLDLMSGYHQVPMNPADVDKTAFSTPFGLFGWLVMPFGLCNGPSVFQRIMNETLEGLIDDCCIVYIDDVLIFSSSWEEHINHIKKVLDRLKKRNLRCKLSKCSFAQKEVSYLGHVVSENGVSPDPSLTGKVRNFPTPTNLTELRGFLGLSGFYRKFIAGYSEIAEPLIALTRKEVPFHWSSHCEIAFNKLKHALVSPPVLAYPDFNKRFLLFTDASKNAMGAVLAQVSATDNLVHPIAFWSKTFNLAQRNYTTTEKECCAIIGAMKQFEWCLFDNFDIITDHSALVWLLNQKQPPTAKIARWITYSQQFTFNIAHRPGKLHGDADALSRAPFDELPPSPETLISTQSLKLAAIIASELVKVKEEGSNRAESSKFPTDTSLSTSNSNVNLNSTPYLSMTSDTQTHHDSSTGQIQSSLENELTRLQRSDEALKPYFEYIENGIVPEDHSNSFYSEVSHMTIDTQKRLVYLTSKSGPMERARMVIPTSLRLPG